MVLILHPERQREGRVGFRYILRCKEEPTVRHCGNTYGWEEAVNL